MYIWQWDKAHFEIECIPNKFKLNAELRSNHITHLCYLFEARRPQTKSNMNNVLLVLSRQYNGSVERETDNKKLFSNNFIHIDK